MVPPPAPESTWIHLDTPETRCLAEKGILGMGLHDFLTARGTLPTPSARGTHFLWCAEGNPHVAEGPGAGNYRFKDALLMPGGHALSLGGLLPRSRFIQVHIGESSPLLPGGNPPWFRKALPGNPDRLWQTLQHLAFDLQSPSPWRREAAALGAAMALRLLSFFLSGLTADLQEELRRSIDDLWSRVAARLDHPWGLEEMADLHGTSARQFDRHCRQILGASPGKHLTALRLGRARLLLSTSRMSVIEVSRLVGYGDPFAFSAAFKRRFGVSPKASRGVGG